MVLEYTSSDKDEPQAIPSGSAPTFAADISEFATWLSGGRTFRKAATQAALIALTGMDDNDLGIVDNIDGAWWRYDGSAGAWRMHGIPKFATAAARTSAITTPADNMLSLRADADYLEQYIGSAWIPLLAPVSRQLDTTNTTAVQLSTQVGIGKIAGAAATLLTEAVTFPVAFATSTTPIVVVQFVGAKTAGAYDPTGTATSSTVSAHSSAHTNSGFTMNIIRDTNMSAGSDYYYSWIAFGVPA